MARSRSDAGSQLYQAVYKVVRRIPRGRVATYGQVAALAGLGGQPRLVGYALHAIEPALEPRAATIPWYRVINAQGRVSFRVNGDRFISLGRMGKGTDSALLATSQVERMTDARVAYGTPGSSSKTSTSTVRAVSVPRGE